MWAAWWATSWRSSWPGLGFDNILVMLGLAKTGPAGKRTPSQVVGWLVMIGIILAAALSAFTMLNLDPLAQLLTGFIVLAGRSSSAC